MVVDLVVPEEGLRNMSDGGRNAGGVDNPTYLVTVSPEEVLGADVLVGVLGPL